MIKVGILSMQRIYNYGSFLQAFGLKKILEDLGCDVEFVDYHPGECLVPICGGKGIFRRMLKGMEALTYNAPFREKVRFIRYKKNYAKNYYPCLGIDDRMNYSPELDILVIGSDEVFNCVQGNPRVGFSPELFGVGNHAGRLISYAASFGNTTIGKLEQYGMRDQIAGWIKEFDSVSVRDFNSGSIVYDLTGKKPMYHLDPVLAYDFITKCPAVPQKVSESEYMILYGYSGRFTEDECSIIQKYAHRKGLKIFCIGGIQNCCDRFIDCSPFQVIAYFQHADCVVTDTFHGTILSVITHRKFISLVRSSGYGNKEKLIDLLKRLNLENRMADCIDNIEELLDQPILFQEMDNMIQTERKRTYEYLEREIQS